MKPSVLLLLFTTLILSACRPKTKPRPKPLNENAHAAPIKDPVIIYDTIPDFEYSYDYDTLKMFLANPVGKYHFEGGDWGYDTLLHDHYVAKIFLKKAAEIDARANLARKLAMRADAKIIEYAAIKAKGISDRAIILWMTGVRVNFNLDDVYTSCIDATTGRGYFSGRTFCSLIDTKIGKMINTEEITFENGFRDTIDIIDIDIPFSILNPEKAYAIGGLKYHVHGGTDSLDGEADVLYLDDYNGNGDKTEFALYQQTDCAGCKTTLYGYSRKLDKLINYPVKLISTYNYDKNGHVGQDTTVISIQKWVEYLFVYKANKEGQIKFYFDYRGRCGSLDCYDVHYNTNTESFEGILDSRMNNDSGYSCCEPHRLD